jgi:very-short-patch-repair endonuclease
VEGGGYSSFLKGGARRAEDFMKLNYNPKLKNFARRLRNSGNLSEVLLWRELRAKKLGVQFLRQRPIGDYIVDFFCSKLNLVIEIDGSSHDLKFEKDEIRDNILKGRGLKVLRFQDLDVKKNLAGVVLAIRQEILRLDYSPPPLKKKSSGSFTRHLL